MKRSTLILVITMSLLIISSLFAEEDRETHPFRLSKAKKMPLDYKLYSLFRPLGEGKDSDGQTEPNPEMVFPYENFSLKRIIPSDPFYLALKKSPVFSLQAPADMIIMPKNKKKFSKTALEITGINVSVWAFNKYVLDKSWAKISFKTVFWNFRNGAEWDLDDIFTNHFMHPLHGAIHFSLARKNGYNFLESTAWALFGSFMWEFFLESVGAHNNPPSLNDLMLNSLGGAALGETMFRTANLVLDDSSVGLERAAREFLAFLINPTFGFRVFSGEAFRRGYPPENHYYNFDLPFGVYQSDDDGTSFLIAASFEYTDFLKSEFLTMKPYDWFEFDLRFAFHDYEIHDVDFEISTTGILSGKKVKNSLAGLFGVFDYMNTNLTDRIGAVGVGPGLITVADPDSDLFFSSSGILSIIIGASTPSLDVEYYHFGKKYEDPYYFGPGMLGRVKLELGKRGLGSIDTSFSQYWVHSIYTSANEFLGILSFKIKCDISNRSQISLGYDYYMRRATLLDEEFSGAKPAIRALYIHKF